MEYKYENPIILKIESKRPLDYNGTDSIELFNAVERAFEFENKKNPYIEVTGVYSNVDYKFICRCLAGCENDITGYDIGMIHIQMLKGDWPEKDERFNLGCTVLCVKNKDLQGNSYQIPYQIGIRPSNQNLSVAQEAVSFFLSNTTIIEIDKIKPGSVMKICFFPIKSYNLKRQKVSNK